LSSKTGKPALRAIVVIDRIGATPILSKSFDRVCPYENRPRLSAPHCAEYRRFVARTF
jgi:hypothetical protein